MSYKIIWVAPEKGKEIDPVNINTKICYDYDEAMRFGPLSWGDENLKRHDFYWIIEEDCLG